MIKVYTIFLLSCLVSLSMNGQVVGPVKKGTTYSFTVKNVYFEIDPQSGARVNSLKLSDQELLYLDKGSNNWGSTFWPTPQALWNWPPPFELDGDVYTAIVLSNVLQLRSKVHSKTGLQFVKNISANEKDTSITITYIINNKNTSSVQVGPWEITRFPSGGITFFPQRASGQQITGDLKPLVVDAGNVSWFDYDSTKIPGGTPKFFSDGSEGWLTHVRRNGNMIIKKFTDSPASQKAPDPENEIEHYAEPNKLYQEVEQQGSYLSLKAGDSLVWNVKWLVRKVPAGIAVGSKNAALANYVRSVIASGLTSTDHSQESDAAGFTIFPNPAANKIYIQLNNGAESMLVANSYGQVVKSFGNFENGSTANVDLSGFTPGMYFIKVVKNNQTQSKSFVVE